MRVILFDIDGTLLLTGGAGLVALGRVYQELHGIEEPVSEVPVHGRTDPVIVQSIARQMLHRELDETEFIEFREAYLRHLEHSLERDGDGFRTLPGAESLVRELAERTDVVLGLATGNFEPAAFAKLRRGGLDGFFGFGGFGSDSEDRDELTRTAVARGRSRAGEDAPVIVVGDTIYDVRSSRAAGVDCLAVATGNASEETLRDAGARWTVPTLEDSATARILGLR